jgi:hypothetical protein
MNIYKLKNGKTSGAFQLPINGVLIPRLVDGETYSKEIQYVPGASSFFKEDHKGDTKPKSIWFDDGELRVSPDNKVLNELLQNHPWFKTKVFFLVNEGEEAKTEIETFEKQTKAANAILNEKDSFRSKSMAMIVISLDAANWDNNKCKAELLKYAAKHSDTLLYEMSKENYEARFLAALAFAKGIVKNNEFNTEVIWADEKGGIIVRVAEGETGVDKLGEFLSKKSESSNTTLQRIGEKVDALLDKNKIEEEFQSGKSIEELQAEAVEAYKATLVNSKTEEELRAEIQAELEAKYINNINVTGEQTEPSVLDLEALKAEYKEVVGKELSPRYYNDPEWIKNKIAEAKNT